MDVHRVSVIIPTFNRAFSLKRCIDSVLNQSYEDFEVIVIDDGSTDNSCDVMQLYLADSRVKYLKHDARKGAQAARNIGIRSAAGDYIAFLDSDDEWVPEKLRIQMDAISEAKQPCVVLGGALVVREGVRGTQRYPMPKLNGYVYNEVLMSPGPLLQCLLAPKVCFERIGYLDEHAPAYQEWDTALALAKCYEFVYCDQPLAIYYLHGGHTISKDKKRAAEGWHYICNKYKEEITVHLGKKVLSQHYLRLYALYQDADEARNATASLLRSFFARPSKGNISAMIGLFFGRKIALMASKSYQLLKRRKGQDIVR
jgi:glycosyltransferase involved in cell wall biosynthesis